MRAKRMLTGVLGAAVVLTGTALATTALERSGRGVDEVIVVKQATEVQRPPSSAWTGGLGQARISVPDGQVDLVRTRLSGGSFCVRGLVGTADCRVRVTWRRAGTTTWILASPGSVRFDALLGPSTEAVEAITQPLSAGSYDVRVEWWAGPDTTFGFTDYLIVFERIPQELA